MSKRILSLVIALAAAVTLSTAQIHNAKNILPKPTKVEMGNSNSKFTLSPTTKVVCKLEDKNVKYALNELNKFGVELFGKAFKKGTKIDNLCQIAHNVEVGPNTVMAAMSGIAGSSKLGEHCILGGQVGIAGHLTVADNTSFGAQTGLQSSVKQPGQSYFGTPALPYMDYMRSYAVFKKAGKK